MARQTMASFCWTMGLVMAAAPVLAQADGIGGRAEFRSPDRPIATPPLESAEWAASDAAKSLTIGPMAADDVLKSLDRELGRTTTRTTTDGDVGRSGAPREDAEFPHRRGPGGTTFK